MKNFPKNVIESYVRMKSCLHVLLLCHVIACKIYQFGSAWTSAACGDIFLLKKIRKCAIFIIYDYIVGL